MARFNPYPRRTYNDLFKAWARRNTKLLGLTTAMTLVLLAFETALILTFVRQHDFRWWILGVFQTAVVAVALHLLNTAFLAHECEAIWKLRGAWGEEATRGELRRAKKQRVIWGWVDSIELQAGDLDHLVLSRKGGFVAIDSKWRSNGTDTAEMARSAARAKLRAEALTRTVLRSERGGHRAKAHAAAVRSTVVVWGPVRHNVPDGFAVDGIEFIRGQQLRTWLQNLPGEQIDEIAAKDALDRLRKFRSRARDDQAAQATSGRSEDA